MINVHLIKNTRPLLYYAFLVFSALIFFCFSWFVLPLPKRYVQYSLGIWSGVACWALGFICGLKLQTRGEQYLSRSSVIYASKHHSSLEILFLSRVFTSKDMEVIPCSKKENWYIPIIGWYIGRGSIMLDLELGVKSLKKLVNQAKAVVDRKGSIGIFPEGERREVQARNPEYKHGVYLLYKHLNIPVVPIAVNTGLFWGRKSFHKTPGMATVEFLPPIETGLSREDFMDRLVNSIEDKTNVLVKEGQQSIKRRQNQKSQKKYKKYIC